MKKLTSFLLAAGMLITMACSTDKPAETINTNQPKTASKPDDGKGIGQVKEVTLNFPLEEERIVRGKAVYEMKCEACHKLGDERIVGPGWKDITKRRKPEWIMNMITNVDIMLDKDPEAQKLLELCLTRMPDQNVSVGDARDILEFMRKNDAE